MNEIIKVEKPKHVIDEDIRWGIFSKHKRKDWDNLMDKFQDRTIFGIEIDELRQLLDEIQSFCEHNFKGKYTKIIISSCEDWDYDYIRKYSTVTLGRYETDEEYDIRIKEEKEKLEKREAERLRKEAKELIRLKQKFEPVEER